MKKRLIQLLCLVLLLALCAPVTALAEPSDGGPTIEKPVIVSIFDDTGALASGISVEIRDESGQAVDAWVTSGSTHTAFLTEGSYKLKIVDAPENYLIDEDETTIVVTLEEAERLSVQLSTMGSITSLPTVMVPQVPFSPGPML